MGKAKANNHCSNNFNRLRTQYEDQHSALETVASFLELTLTNQLRKNLSESAFSVSARVKKWDSLESKLKRLERSFSSIHEIQDLIGVRVVVPFSSQILQVESSIAGQFSFIRRDETGKRLGDREFGYSSLHLIAQPIRPLNFKSIPQKLRQPIFEIQLRTTSQHIWAEVSHMLQYKREDTLPHSLKRSINRLSAVLELVDLEIERFFQEFKMHESGRASIENDSLLNIQTVELLCDQYLPPKNKTPAEDYAELIGDLAFVGVQTSGQLEKLLLDHKDDLSEYDRRQVEQLKSSHPEAQARTRHRSREGVALSHSGLVRHALGMLNPERMQERKRNKEFLGRMSVLTEVNALREQLLKIQRGGQLIVPTPQSVHGVDESDGRTINSFTALTQKDRIVLFEKGFTEEQVNSIDMIVRSERKTAVENEYRYLDFRLAETGKELMLQVFQNGGEILKEQLTEYQILWNKSVEDMSELVSVMEKHGLCQSTKDGFRLTLKGRDYITNYLSQKMSATDQ